MYDALKIYLKKEYGVYLLERKRLIAGLNEKIKQPGVNFTLPELIDSLALKMAADRLVYFHYWHCGNKLLNEYFRNNAVARQREGKVNRYFTFQQNAASI